MLTRIVLYYANTIYNLLNVQFIGLTKKILSLVLIPIGVLSKVKRLSKINSLSVYSGLARNFPGNIFHLKKKDLL